jgi:ketosteroid isomerase-like protein
MGEHGNVQRLREGYEAFAKGDLAALREFFADDILWHVPGDSPISGDYKGYDEVMGFFGRIMQETNGTLRNDVHDMLANDEHAVVLVDTSAQRGDKTLKARAAHVMHIKDGKITEFWNFTEDSTVFSDFWS